MRVWILRAVVLTVLAVVLYVFGPKAWIVLAARFGADPYGQRVDLDLVGPGAAPVWLQRNPALYRAVLEELAPCLKTEIRLQDEAALTALSASLTGLSWVADVRLAPAATDRFQLRLQLYRPVLEVLPEGAVAGRVKPVFVTASGICVHHSDYDLASGLPVCRLIAGPVPGSAPVYLLGQEHPDPRVLAAAAVAVEWRDQIASRMPAAPPLIEVDATNLNYGFLSDKRFSQVRVVLRRADGGAARFDYGHPPGYPTGRVSVADKIAVLEKILAKYPGLLGVARADLRLVNTWERWVRLEPTAGDQARASVGR